ncbi:chorismate mutase [Tepidimicrobium xylanilyticum]|uniref:chorismate mutase n=1 Tax=Tepidimicrobium xylanilyticum TaxID=1123352 RepID=A0A1H3CWW6_9FIRM|nr:chorismate mutase [Tepidimicrobium xylanilyticum]GMG97760.1 chorismate mutase AroH [Tepidimicrobium xylanilyticum]SDX58641.1 chorismate mutase [Tepidimicrobium xylanilyticum]
MKIVSIRGATTANSNNEADILDATRELLLEIENRNNIQREKVISILFSATKDLNAVYPAKAARLLGYTQCGLMCFNEMDVVGSLDKCIRVMVLYQDCLDQESVKHVYLKKAKTLRPDLNI